MWASTPTFIFRFHSLVPCFVDLNADFFPIPFYDQKWTRLGFTRVGSYGFATTDNSYDYSPLMPLDPAGEVIDSRETQYSLATLIVGRVPRSVISDFDLNPQDPERMLFTSWQSPIG